jgi:hypothetical protein
MELVRRETGVVMTDALGGIEINVGSDEKEEKRSNEIPLAHYKKAPCVMTGAADVRARPPIDTPSKYLA